MTELEVALALERLGGRVEDPQGHATRIVADELGIEVRPLSSVLKDMERRRLVERLTRGRRTYVIRLGPRFKAQRRAAEETAWE